MAYRKKLIEVAIPLDAVNDASAYDTLPGIGAHPKNLHYWWARVPLPSARAVLFTSLVDDPSSDPRFASASSDEQDRERERLFEILRRLMPKKPHEHPEVFEAALEEIRRCCNGDLPAVSDPFSGGGAIPLEAHRLGLKAYGGDLNPIAVLVTRAQLEILPAFRTQAPVNPESRETIRADGEWQRAQGLAEDVRYYGARIREQAEERIGDLFPTATLPASHGGREAPALAWIWARTVRCPNPACRAEAPLLRSFNLSTKKGRRVWLQPVVDNDASPPEISFEVHQEGVRPKGSGTIGRGGGRCLACDTTVPLKYIRAQGQHGELGEQLIAVVADGDPGRVYLVADDAHQRVAMSAEPTWLPGTSLPDRALGFRVQNYGLTRHADLFTARQATALSTFADLIRSAREDIERDATQAGLADDGVRFSDGGRGATAYADAMQTFLALTVDRLADYNCSLSTWKPSGEQQMHLFTYQAIRMVWDFAEANVLGEKAICWHNAVHITADGIETVLVDGGTAGEVIQHDATRPRDFPEPVLISTDPPYYDNVPYADLSDFFYVWSRRILADVHPDLFRTLLVPKEEELVADAQRFDGKEAAREHFEGGFRRAFTQFREAMDPRFPLTLFYAFKQGEDEISVEGAVARTTGWETILQALVDTGFQVTATWPVSASQKWRMRAMGSNTVTSYIVLACRPREADAPLTTRRDFLAELREALPEALHHLQLGNIAPVDLAQAAIGPGMAVFSKYSKVLETDGEMKVRGALQAIIETLETVLTEQEAEFDADTRWAIQWYEQFGMDEGPYGAAETLSKAKNTSVSGLVEAGIVKSGRGEVRLLGRGELDAAWDPTTDPRLTIWEATQHLIRTLDEEGEEGAARLLRKIGGLGDVARDLAYRLYATSERKSRPKEALSYNALVVAWPEIKKLAGHSEPEGPAQTELL